MYSGPELTEQVGGYEGGDQTARGRAIIMCYDKHNGQLAGPSIGTGRPIRFTTWEYRQDIHNLWDLRLNQRFSPATYGGQHRYSNTGMCETTNALGLTSVGERLVASMFYDNELLVLNPDSLEIVKRIPVKSPAGLHGLDARQLLAVSGTRVVRVDVESGAVTTVIDQGLSAPFGVTTDREGTIYVSDWGDSFQVKAFDVRGSLLRAIGKPGGRPWVGSWVADGMAVPRGIAITDNDRLWVAEDEFSPRRISVWDPSNGALIRDYIGPANYRGWGLAIDPLNPRRIITTGTEFMLDFDNKTYTPTRKMVLRRGRDDAFMIDGNEMVQFARIIHREGREFHVEGRGGRLVILERRGDEYRAVAGVSRHEYGPSIYGTDRTVWDSDLGRHRLPDWYPEFFKGQAGNNYIWNDLNGDGIMQENEVSWDNTLRRGDAFQPGRMGEWGPNWSVGFGPNWESYLTSRSSNVWESYRLDPEFTANGMPRYSFDRARPIIHYDEPYGGDWISNIYASNSGKVYVTYRAEVQGGRPSEMKNGNACYDRDGNELWSIAPPRDPKTESVFGYPNAEFHYPDLGSGIVTWVWWHNGLAYLLSEDGLYLGVLLDNDAGSGPTVIHGYEVSTFAFQKPDGRLYLVNGNDSAHHILEIQGLETAKRFEAALTITAADARAAAEAKRIETEASLEAPGILVGRTDTAPPMDGTLADWDIESEGVVLKTDRTGRGGRFALKTDGTNLFIAARIEDDTPMVNNGESWQTPFITGDCVDLMLATNPDADPGRRSAAPGDLRLLFTELRGEPMAVLYRQSVPGTTNPVQMLATYIDDVRRLPEATPVIRRHADGYTLTASVPLASLGLKTLPRELRGDVGIIYGNATGRDRDQRLYYYNQDTGMISDLTTEARVSPDKWGRIVFAAPGDLIKNGGFEAELGDMPLGNWHVESASNGASAQLTTRSAFAGRQSLLLTSPGPGRVAVIQRVPVDGGRSYDLRYAYRASGLVPEIRSGAPYAFFSVEVTFLDGNNRHIRNPDWATQASQSRSVRAAIDRPMWMQVHNRRRAESMAPFAEGMATDAVFTAPENAAYAEISLALLIHDIEKQSEVFIDQVELTPIRQ